MQMYNNQEGGGKEKEVKACAAQITIQSFNIRILNVCKFNLLWIKTVFDKKLVFYNSSADGLADGRTEA